MMEPTDELTQEISYLHLTSRAPSPNAGVTFADVQGRFRWWRMIGTFKGLYRPEGASENLWYFGGVSWQHLSDEEGGPQPGEDPAERSQDGFGLAAILASDDNENPFLEMLYKKELSDEGAQNMKDIKEEHNGDVKTEANEENENENIPDASAYTRIVWKKQKNVGQTSPLAVSDREALNLLNYCEVEFDDNNIGQQTWQLVRDAAVKKGTVSVAIYFSTNHNFFSLSFHIISTSTSRTVSADMLLGSYGAVWDSYTNLEMMDDMGEEYSWLDLTAPVSNGKSEPDFDPGARTHPDAFRNIRGTFRWWNMIGSFKGLYKPEDAAENFWIFGGVTWRDEDEEEVETEDNADRETDYFGISVLPVLDKRGRPFIEMLYNSTGYEERKKLSNSTSGGATRTTTRPNKFVRILFKKYEAERIDLTQMLSRGEGRRLMRNANIDLSKSREPLDDENDNDSEDGGDEEEGDEEEEEMKSETDMETNKDEIPSLKRAADNGMGGSGSNAKKVKTGKS